MRFFFLVMGMILPLERLPDGQRLLNHWPFAPGWESKNQFEMVDGLAVTARKLLAGNGYIDTISLKYTYLLSIFTRVGVSPRFH